MNYSQEKVKSYSETHHVLAGYTSGRHYQKQPLEAFYKKAVLKNFAILSGKQLCWSHFLIKLQAFRPATLLKRESNTGVFL